MAESILLGTANMLLGIMLSEQLTEGDGGRVNLLID
jgi:hypothetical protein